MRRPVFPPIALAVALALAPLAATGEGARQPPYWASIGVGQARLRTGPARTYPANWLYRRVDLPVRVVATFREWRRIEDPDGTQGWMQANLLRDTRTAVVSGAAPVAMLERPAAGARLLWRAAPGVVGRVTQCGNGWCRFDVKGQAGFVEVDGLWGVEARELLP